MVQNIWLSTFHIQNKLETKKGNKKKVGKNQKNLPSENEEEEQQVTTTLLSSFQQYS
jgi:hypothetical protein